MRHYLLFRDIMSCSGFTAALFARTMGNDRDLVIYIYEYNIFESSILIRNLAGLTKKGRRASRFIAAACDYSLGSRS